MKKRICMILVVLMALCCACGKQKTGADARKDANEIYVGIGQDLSSSLSPYAMSSAGTREVMFNVFEGLYKVDSTGDFKPALATGCTVSDDGLTYTFTIRENVKFHNGSVMTPADVVWSYKTCASDSVDSAMKAVLENVESVTAEGNTVVIKLAAPNSDFMAYVASVYISPADYTEQDTKPVGTGPFSFVSRTVQDSIVIKRFDDYWGNKAKFKTLIVRSIPEPTNRTIELETGAVDIAYPDRKSVV